MVTSVESSYCSAFPFISHHLTGRFLARKISDMCKNDVGDAKHILCSQIEGQWPALPLLCQVPCLCLFSKLYQWKQSCLMFCDTFCFEYWVLCKGPMQVLCCFVLHIRPVLGKEKRTLFASLCLLLRFYKICIQGYLDKQCVKSFSFPKKDLLYWKSRDRERKGRDRQRYREKNRSFFHSLYGHNS